jgi:hypothetical protein
VGDGDAGEGETTAPRRPATGAVGAGALARVGADDAGAGADDAGAGSAGASDVDAGSVGGADSEAGGLGSGAVGAGGAGAGAAGAGAGACESGAAGAGAAEAGASAEGAGGAGAAGAGAGAAGATEDTASVTGDAAGATASTVSVAAGTASERVCVTGVSGTGRDSWATAGEAVKSATRRASPRARLRGIGVTRDARAAPADPRFLFNWPSGDGSLGSLRTDSDGKVCEFGTPKANLLRKHEIALIPQFADFLSATSGGNSYRCALIGPKVAPIGTGRRHTPPAWPGRSRRRHEGDLTA